MNKDPSLEEWFGRVIVARERVRIAVAELTPLPAIELEYQERYEGIIEVSDHALRSISNQLNLLARHAEKRLRDSKPAEKEHIGNLEAELGMFKMGFKMPEDPGNGAVTPAEKGAEKRE